MATDQVDALVIFGATGDLAKLETFPALVGLVERGVLDVPVIGVAKNGWGLEQFRQYATDSLTLNKMDPSSEAAQKMLGLLRYVDGDLADHATYEAMADALGDGKRVLYYLEVPPVLFGRIADGIAAAGRAKDARVMVEKPFGTDLASAQQLNDTMHQYFPRTRSTGSTTGSAFEPVENLLFVRFANSIIEPLLNRNYVERDPDHDGRGVRRRPTGAASTTGPARSGTWCRTTCCRCSPRCWPIRPGAGPGVLAGREARPDLGAVAALAEDCGPRPVRRLPAGRGRGAEVDDRDLRGGPPGRRHPGGGPACRS